VTCSAPEGCAATRWHAREALCSVSFHLRLHGDRRSPEIFSCQCLPLRIMIMLDVINVQASRKIARRVRISFRDARAVLSGVLRMPVSCPARHRRRAACAFVCLTQPRAVGAFLHLVLFRLLFLMFMPSGLRRHRQV